MPVCHFCGTPGKPGALHCSACNAPLPLAEETGATKFCRHCGQKIPEKAVVCTKCGCQVEELVSLTPQPVIVNNNKKIIHKGTPKSKWTAFVLCLLLGMVGAHRFYEGKIASGLLYVFTGGLFGIGVFVDLIVILCKKDPYYV